MDGSIIQTPLRPVLPGEVLMKITYIRVSYYTKYMYVCTKDNVLFEEWTEQALYIHVRRILPPYTITPPGYHFYHRLGGNMEEGGKLSTDQVNQTR